MTTINYYQKLSLESIWMMLDQVYQCLQPDIYLDAVDYAWQCGEEDSFFEDYTAERYWLLLQKLCCCAIIKLESIGLLSNDSPKAFIKESFSLPNPDDYWALIDTKDGLPLGIGLTGTGSLQKYLYTLSGWSVGEERFYITCSDIYREYQLFRYILDTFPRKCWGRIVDYIEQVLMYHCDEDFVLLYLHYKDMDIETIKRYYSDLLFLGESLIMVDEQYIIYFTPSERYSMADLASETDFSSLHLAGAFLAYMNSLRKPLALPCDQTIVEKEGAHV